MRQLDYRVDALTIVEAETDTGSAAFIRRRPRNRTRNRQWKVRFRIPEPEVPRTVLACSCTLEDVQCVRGGIISLTLPKRCRFLRVRINIELVDRNTTSDVTVTVMLTFFIILGSPFILGRV